MKRNDIDKVLSQKVLSYMMDGYTINTSSMTGHQGEEGKVDLVKGEVLIRVWLNKESNYRWLDNDDAWSGDTMVLRVGKWIHEAHLCDINTVWMKDFEIIDEITYYQVGRRNEWYLDNLEEAKAAREKTLVRMHRPSRSRKMRVRFFDDEWAKDLAVRYLKRKAGYKRVCRDNVRLSHDYKLNKYFVGYNLQSYELR